jgi:hypothetical protein
MIKEAVLMTIQITKPEVEALINQRLQTGGFKDAEDVVFQALQSSPPTAARPRKTLRNSLHRCEVLIWISVATHRLDAG